MRALLDVNFLIAILDTSHVFHERAAIWLATHSSLGWATCPLTQNGCVRIVSQTNYSARLSTPMAIASLQTACSAQSHRFWPDDASILNSQTFDPGAFHHPRQVTDVYLLALAVKNHGRLITFDQHIPLTAVRAAKPQHLVVV